MVFNMKLLIHIHIIQFLLVLDYIHMYQLYVDVIYFINTNKYNSYKTMINIYIIYTKFLKNNKTSTFGMKRVSDICNSMIILSSKHRGMLRYFLKFFCSVVSLFIVNFCFFYYKCGLFGTFHLCLEQLSVCQTLLRKDNNCWSTLAVYI